MNDLAGNRLPWCVRDKRAKARQMKASSAKPFTELVILDTNPIPSRPRLKVFKRYIRGKIKEIIPGHGNKLFNCRTEDDELGASSLEQDARNKPVRHTGHFTVLVKLLSFKSQFLNPNVEFAGMRETEIYRPEKESTIDAISVKAYSESQLLLLLLLGEHVPAQQKFSASGPSSVAQVILSDFHSR